MQQVSIALPLFSGNPAPGFASPMPAGTSEGASPFAEMVEAMTAGLPATGPDMPDIPGGDLTLAGLDPATTDGVYAALAAVAAKAATTNVAAASGTDAEVAIAIPTAKPQTEDAEAPVLPSVIALAAAAFGKKTVEDGKPAEAKTPADGEPTEASGETEDTQDTLDTAPAGIVPPGLGFAAVPPPPAPSTPDGDLLLDAVSAKAAAGTSLPLTALTAPTDDALAAPTTPADAAEVAAPVPSAPALAAAVPPAAHKASASAPGTGETPAKAADAAPGSAPAVATGQATTDAGTPPPGIAPPSSESADTPDALTVPSMATAFAPTQTDEAMAALAALAKDALAATPAAAAEPGTADPLALDPPAFDPLAPDVDFVLTGPAIAKTTTPPQATGPMAFVAIDEAATALAGTQAVAASDEETDGSVKSADPVLVTAPKPETGEAKSAVATPPVKPSDLPVLQATLPAEEAEEAAETVATPSTSGAAALDDLDEALAQDEATPALQNRPEPARTPPPVAATALAFAARLKQDAKETRTEASTEAAQVAALGARQATQATPAVAQSTAPPATVLNMVPIPMVGAEIARMAKLGETSFQIRLDPPELGRIDVSLDLSDSGEAKAHLTVERRDTLDLFARDHRALERALREAGFEARDGSVSVSLRNGGSGEGNPRFAGGQFQDGNARPQFSSPYGDGSGLEADTSSVAAADLYRPRRDALVDVRL